MVNTFLIDADFKKSAEMLDTKRLGKQRVEALQILHLIQYLRILSIYYASIENSPGPIPLNPYDQYLWIRKVAKLYNSSPTRLLKRNGLWYEVDKNIKMIRMATNEEIESDILEIQKMIGNKKLVIVSHYSVYINNKLLQSRYELIKTLENICKKHNLIFIQPNEIIGDDKLQNQIISSDLGHYTSYGHKLFTKNATSFLENIFIKD